jgi:Mg-chelatase subunit ChlD
MFVVDATGSMGDEINYLKSELEDIVGRVQSSDNQEVIRLGMTFYRDHGDEYLVRNFDFKTDIKQIQADLNQQSAGGGGDFEEAVDEALDNAINQQQWSTTATTRLLFLILDAPPHHDLQRIKTMQKNIEAAAEKGIKIIPVVASGIDKNTEFLMRMTAQATNGTYVFLTDDSGVGNSHLKPTIGSYQVEYLNNLILRLIKKYSSTKSDL